MPRRHAYAICSPSHSKAKAENQSQIHRCWPRQPKEREQGLSRAGCKGTTLPETGRSCGAQSRRVTPCPVAQVGAWFVGEKMMVIFNPGSANPKPSQGSRAGCGLCRWVQSCQGRHLRIVGRRQQFPSLPEMFCQSSVKPLQSQIRSAGGDQK